MSMIRITKKFDFETGHALYGYDGKCKNIHGHSYKLFVTVQGTPITDTTHVKYGMVIDFTDLKKGDKKKPSNKQIKEVNPDLMKQVLGPSMDLSNVNNELKNIEEKQLLAMRSIEKLTPLMGMANDMLKRLENIKDKPLV